SEYGDKVPANHKEAIERALADLKEAHKSQDMGRIDGATEALTAAWNAASQDIYQATQAANGGSTDAGGTTGTPPGGGTQDVEFEEVKS
ncbi:MAG TPA: molecular chaperone DnaK, partial [Saprospiraceae bacterium]|nr:molecular chaperone DnaK [Saprospiraceae bacterium]